jgi:uncharacterized protein YndB with AHSA1/START domain
MEAARLAERPSLTLERFYPVGPEKVWRAWTEPQALTRAFGPGETFIEPDYFLQEACS